MADIVKLCSSLKKLNLKSCTFVPLTGNAVFGSKFPHYKCLTGLKITETPEPQIYYRRLHHYVNLQTLHLEGVNVMTDDLIDDAIRQGAFRNIVRFYIKETGDGALTMRAAELLIQHCEHLKELGYLRSWGRLNPELISNLTNRMTMMNFHLHIV
jgi:hypothetical protein